MDIEFDIPKIEREYLFIPILEDKGEGYEMRIKAYMNITWVSEKVHALPGEKDDTLGRLQVILHKWSKIPGLKEAHVVFGPLAMIATAETDTMEELTNVQNEMQKSLPIKTVTTFIVQPQLRPGEKAKDLNFT